MSSEKKEKTAEQKLAEQKAAEEQLEALLNQSRPKNLRQGLGTGIGNIVGGAIGAVGVVVMAPMVGASQGAKGGGVIGAGVGLVSGAVAGVLGGTALALGGTVSGLTQIARGVAAAPAALTAPGKGKWWNENEGKWILTNLETEKKTLVEVPKNDDDILGEARKDAEKSVTESIVGGKVKETYYYDALGVEPTADRSIIKRQYYILAKQYHPDKVGTNDVMAAEKFKLAAEAYQVLSDPELRKKYDKEGREGLSADRTEVADGVAKIDPSLLFAFLFGSDKFQDYVGNLAMATAASVADSPKISVKDARKVQKRRCTRLAISLAERLSSWVEEDHDLARTMWKTEAEELAKASYGIELVHLIGKIYSLAAVQFLGSLDSGIGMPGISRWAESNYAQMQRNHQKNVGKVETLKAGMKMVEIQGKAQAAMEGAKTESERKFAEVQLEADMSTAMLKIMWTTTTVDITNTLHETCQMVLFDQSVDKEKRKKRGHGLKELGKIFTETPPPRKEEQEGMKDAKQMYEEAAFAAMLETVKRKEEQSFHASIKH